MNDLLKSKLWLSMFMPPTDGPVFEAAMEEQRQWCDERVALCDPSEPLYRRKTEANRELRKALAPWYAEARIRIGVDQPPVPLTRKWWQRRKVKAAR